MVLGSGDAIPGVDLGLYDMCPGDVRQLQIPEALGHGPQSRARYRIPETATLDWIVELVAVNGVRRRQNNDNDDDYSATRNRSRDEMEGRVPYSISRAR